MFIKEKLESNLPYDLDYIPKILQKKAKYELFEDEETRAKSLRLFKSMLSAEPDLYWQDDDLFLLSFLRARKFDVKRALNLLKTFYTVTGKYHELFSNFNFDMVKKTLEDNKLLGFLPYRDNDGCCIILVGTETWDPRVHNLGALLRVVSCGLVHANLSPATQIAGIKIIIDFGGITFKHVPYLSPNYLLAFAEGLQSSFPARFPAIHVVNQGLFFSLAWAVAKTVLSKKIEDRFHFHGKDMQKLHEYIPPSILPAEYEGNLPPYSNAEWSRKMEESAEYIKKVYSHGFGKYLNKYKNK